MMLLLMWLNDAVLRWQWCTVGDTYPVGIAPRDCIAFGVKSFADCVDMKSPSYK